MSKEYGFEELMKGIDFGDLFSLDFPEEPLENEQSHTYISSLEGKEAATMERLRYNFVQNAHDYFKLKDKIDNDGKFRLGKDNPSFSLEEKINWDSTKPSLPKAHPSTIKAYVSNQSFNSHSFHEGPYGATGRDVIQLSEYLDTVKTGQWVPFDSVCNVLNVTKDKDRRDFAKVLFKGSIFDLDKVKEFGNWEVNRDFLFSTMAYFYDSLPNTIKIPKSKGKKNLTTRTNKLGAEYIHLVNIGYGKELSERSPRQIEIVNEIINDFQKTLYGIAKAIITNRVSITRKGKMHLMRVAPTSPVTVEELVNEGAIAIIENIHRYDGKSNCRTFINYSIKGRMHRYGNDQFRIMRLPPHVTKVRKLEQYKDTWQDVCHELERMIENKELPQPVDKIPKSMLAAAIYLGATNDYDDIYETNVICEEYDPEPSLMHSELVRDINFALLKLTPKYQRVIKLRFGLDGESEHTLDAVGKELNNVCGETIRQNEAKALRKLRGPKTKKKLIGHL